MGLLCLVQKVTFLGDKSQNGHIGHGFLGAVVQKSKFSNFCPWLLPCPGLFPALLTTCMQPPPLQVPALHRQRSSPVKQVLGKLGVQGKTQLFLQLAPLFQVAPDTDAALAAPGVQLLAFLLANHFRGPLVARVPTFHHPKATLLRKEGINLASMTGAQVTARSHSFNSEGAVAWGKHFLPKPTSKPSSRMPRKQAGKSQCTFQAALGWNHNANNLML